MEAQQEEKQVRFFDLDDSKTRIEELEFQIQELQKTLWRQSEMIWTLRDWINDQSVRVDANTAKIQTLSQ